MNHKLVSLLPPRRNVPCFAVFMSTLGNADLVYSRIERDPFMYYLIHKRSYRYYYKTGGTEELYKETYIFLSFVPF